MSQIEKLLSKFLERPEVVRYADIERILTHLGFENIHTKGSHVKWKHRKLQHDLIIPLHNAECKAFYKKQVLRQIDTLIKRKT